MATARIITFIELGLVVERTRYTWEAVIASRLGLHSRWLFKATKTPMLQGATSALEGFLYQRYRPQTPLIKCPLIAKRID